METSFILITTCYLFIYIVIESHTLSTVVRTATSATCNGAKEVLVLPISQINLG